MRLNWIQFFICKKKESLIQLRIHDYIKTGNEQVSGRECFKLFADELRICNEVVKSNGVLILGKHVVFWKGINGTYC